MKKSEEKIIKFVVENYRVNQVIDSKLDLFKNRIIDSIGIVELVHFLEKEFEVNIPFETVSVDDLKNVESMIALIEKKKIK